MLNKVNFGASLDTTAVSKGTLAVDRKAPGTSLGAFEVSGDAAAVSGVSLVSAFFLTGTMAVEVAPIAGNLSKPVLDGLKSATGRRIMFGGVAVGDDATVGIEDLLRLNPMDELRELMTS